MKINQHLKVNIKMEKELMAKEKYLTIKVI